MRERDRERGREREREKKGGGVGEARVEGVQKLVRKSTLFIDTDTLFFLVYSV